MLCQYRNTVDVLGSCGFVGVSELICSERKMVLCTQVLKQKPEAPRQNNKVLHTVQTITDSFVHNASRQASVQPNWDLLIKLVTELFEKKKKKMCPH